MTPKLLFPVWMANLLLIGLAETTAAVAIAFILGQGAMLLVLLLWRRADRAERKAWTDALTEAHTSAQALIRAADLRHLELLKPPNEDTA